MKRILTFILICCLLPCLSWSQGFTIAGTQLRDANGNNFIMKGVNIPLAWFVSDVNNNIANIRNNTGANCVRIVLNTGTADNSWHTCVEQCIANKMIPMLELHDVTGSNSSSSLQSMASWWASKASYLTQQNIARYVLINIANEWGDWFMSSPNNDPPQSQWRDAYIAAVQTIRNAGINTTLVVDAPGYGQDNQGSTLINYAQAVQNSDPRHNVLFSVHMYCEWSINGNSSVTTHLPAIKNAGIPIIVGEFGFQHSEGSGTCDINETQIMSTCQSNGVGWLAWSWKGNGSPVQYLDLSNDWAGASLTSWGNTVVNGTNGTKTSQVASVFSSGCTPTAITPYVQINGGTWQQTSSASVSAGASIKFGPQPVSGGSWNWSGPNGFSASSREVTIANIQTNQAGNYTATYTNPGGCKSTQVFTVTVNGGSSTIVVRARGTQGSETIDLRVNNTTVATWTLTTSYQNYSASGSGAVSVYFTNDNGPRDVQIDYVTIGGTTYQAESQPTNTGVWQNNSCGGSNSEWLHCNGFISFSGSSGARIANGDHPATTSSMEETLDAFEVLVFPNPAIDKITVRVGEAFKGSMLSLINATGQVLYANRLQNREQVIDMSAMNEGLYLVHLSGKTSVQVNKVFKK